MYCFRVDDRYLPRCAQGDLVVEEFQRTITLFQRMDVNKDGVISVEEFMDTCRKVSSHLANVHVRK